MHNFSMNSTIYEIIYQGSQYGVGTQSMKECRVFKMLFSILKNIYSLVLKLSNYDELNC